MGIMSILAEMHGTPDFKLNLKFEIEVLCKQLEIQLSVSEIDRLSILSSKKHSNFVFQDLPIHHILTNKDYLDKIEKQLSTTTHQVSSVLPVNPSPQPPLTPSVPKPKYKLSDFKPSTFQSLSSMLEINSNIALFRHHPHLKTYIHSPIEQAINESFQTVQRSLKVATSAAETIVRKDFLLNPDEQQLRTSARNMVAYLSSGLVLITARSALQEQIQSYIKTHLHTVLGISPTATTNTNEQTTSDMIQQAALEIATSNIELCCCLLQRITISRAIQLIDQRLLNDIEIRQRCRSEGRQLPVGNNMNEERLPEQIRLHYGPLSSHQLAIYEDFVHFIPGFKPNDNEKRDLVTVSFVNFI
jgi:CCR4-NOT transcription complex subunit 1